MALKTKKTYFVPVLLMAVFLVFVWASPAMAGGACPEVVPKVLVKSLTKKTKKYNNRSAYNLTMLHNEDPRNIKSMTMGLYTSPFKITAEYRYKTTEIGEKTCVSLDEIRVKFYTQPVLLVASNFPQKSCEFKAVLEHEKGHDRILRRVQRDYSRKTKSEMNAFVKRFKGAGAVSKDRIPVIQGRIEGQIERKLGGIIDEAANVLNNRQSTHDNAKEYKRVNDMCDGWVRRLSSE